MTTLYITSHVAATNVALGVPEQEETVDISGGSLQSAVIEQNGTTPYKRVRLFADGVCHVKIGENPTATTTSMPLAAEADIYVDVIAGHRIAVIERTTP